MNEPDPELSQRQSVEPPAKPDDRVNSETGAPGAGPTAESESAPAPADAETPSREEASGGGPTGSGDAAPVPSPGRRNLLGRIVHWLRAGYPEGVPRSDYLALYAVLRRHLSDQEVAAIADEVVRANPESEITHADIEAAIARFAKQQPKPSDVSRVAAHLAAGGWPLDTPQSDAS